MEQMSRRSFLKTVSLASVSAMVLPGILVSCDEEEVRKTDKPVATIRATKGNMSYRTNPNTGNSVSILGYGTMHILPSRNGNTGGKAGAGINQEALNRSVDYAIDHGVNFFNTAPSYGNGDNEKALGAALSRHPRKSYFVSTKLSNFDSGQQTAAASKAMFYNSLKNLQVDTFDLYLLHNIGIGGMDMFNRRFIDNGMLDFLQQQQRNGVVRNLGFSFSGDIEVFNHAMAMHDAGVVKWNVAQVCINYVDWFYPSGGANSDTDSRYLYNELVKRGIPVNAVDPLHGGQLGTVSRPVSEKMRKMRPDDTVSSWAMRFVGSLEGVMTIVVGMAYMEHLKDNVYTCSPLAPMTDEEIRFIDKVARRVSKHPYVKCVRCYACSPCRYGVDIVGVFDRYNMCLDDDSIMVDPDDESPSDYSRMRRAFLVGMDCSVSKMRQADHCIGCGECVAKCPRQIDIPAKMRTISDYTERLRSKVL